jgi:lipopolysaccharide/colanic/teichoic acid biosynthesis glycosyltransferase
MIRLFDIILSSFALILLTPFMIPIMIGLKLTGEHDIFYQQTRVGRGGKDFKVLKFATMLRNSPALPGGVLTQKNDPRILPMGNFLRKTKINELPQLINIMRGEMSFVGPRPQARRHYDLYADEVTRAIDTIPPGLTGIGSVVFRDEEDILHHIEGDRDYFHDAVIAPYKGELEIWFVSHRNLVSYCALILLTAWCVLFPRSMLYKRVFKSLPTPPKNLAKYLLSPNGPNRS